MELENVLRAGVDRAAVPGVAAVVVDRFGVRWQGAAGQRSIATGDVMTADTVGAIFSMTKAITGAAAMHCVERGLLALDAPAADVLEDLANPRVLTGFDGEGMPITRPATGAITLRNLLTHTSGYVYDLWNTNMARWYEATATPALFSRQKRALRTPLAFDPGERWEYGIGIDWAGQMVEAVTGSTLGDYFAEHLFEPLGMHDTAFAPTPAMAERRAGMHTRRDDGSFAPMQLQSADEPEFEMGGGGLFGTVLDYGRFMQMVLNGGAVGDRQVLAADTVEAMCTNSMGPLRVSKLTSAVPALSNDVELFPGEEKSWGLTFQIHEEPGSTGRPSGTLSWAGLANSYFFIDRRNGIAGAYLSQVLPFADVGSLELYYEFERAIYEAL